MRFARQDRKLAACYGNARIECVVANMGYTVGYAYVCQLIIRKCSITDKRCVIGDVYVA